MLMRYSKLFGKTRKEAPRDAESVNAQLLIRAGFVEPLAAGIYAWLPLGVRVLRKVERIVREEMDAAGAQEVLLPALHPKDLWEQTGRWSTMDVLFKTTSQTGKEYGLGPTHEEVITPIAQRFLHSYRDLPVALYQIQTKFRDELRAKAGVLRGREFGMKDCYSFHADHAEFQEFYDRILAVYQHIYERCGLTPIRVHASGGSFTKKFSDEFHVETAAGEDRLLRCATCAVGYNEEVAPADQRCPTCSGPLIESRGIEVGNTFDLETTFADAFDCAFTDAQGAQQRATMGCYGIGTTRLVGAIVEAHHDDRGIIWPAPVSPFDVHVVAISAPQAEESEDVFAAAEQVAQALARQGMDVLLDDRADVHAGAKLADADLIGITERVVVSARSLRAGGVERKSRASATAAVCTSEQLLQALVATRSMGTHVVS